MKKFHIQKAIILEALSDTLIQLEVNKLKNKTIRVLEFDKILDLLQARTVSALGKEIAKELTPSVEFYEIVENLKETTEAVELSLKKGNIPLFGIQDIRGAVKKCVIGGQTSLVEFLWIADTLKTCVRLKKYIKEDKTEGMFPTIEYFIDTLTVEKKLESRIREVILSEEEIADNASPELYSMRRKIKEKTATMREKLNHMITSSSYTKYLQEPIVTIRNDRFVIPIKQEFKNNVPGIVHDQSASGATLFIEPMSVVEMNNDIKRLRLDEEAEIEKILLELGAMVSEVSDGLETNVKILATLDFINAKAKLALDFACVAPVMNSDRRVDLKKARHPLLKQDSVVPINIILGDKFDSLVVTGPNTGGKTVTLKTLGLLTLMAQAGLHIPASDGSELAVFKQVFADIGDEQSIEQSLSTFSSHMINIVSIMKDVNEDSLVLFDELGAGTDPTEGAALAISILETLHEKKIRTVATTHYAELKYFALTTQGISNASVEFDLATLRPTYKLIIGLPGKSNAFEISRKLGLDEKLIERARIQLSSEEHEIEDLLKNLEENRKIAEDEKFTAQRLKQAAAEEKAVISSKMEKIDTQKDRILREAEKKALDIIRDAKEEADKLISELRASMKMDSAEKESAISNARQKLKKNSEKYEDSMSGRVLSKKSAEPPKNLKIGDQVKVLSLGQRGTVLTIPDNEGNLTVQMGIMKVNVNIDALELDETEKKKEKTTYNLRNNIQNEKVKSSSTSVDVRGLNLDEAIMEVDKFIDDCYLASIPYGTIIHGKGTGVLSAGIKQHLRAQKYVKSYRMGGISEGGSGATIIEIEN